MKENKKNTIKTMCVPLSYLYYGKTKKQHDLEIIKFRLNEANKTFKKVA